MKKLFASVLILVVVLVAVVLFRAGSAYPDRQVAPATLGELPQFDEDAAVSRFAGALRFPTISYDDRSNFDAASFEALRAYLEANFPLVHERAQPEIIAGHSLLYTLPGSDPSLKAALFAGHIDVVPVDDITLDEWTHPPFDGIVADGTVWGRGALDDKLTVLALLEALEFLLADGLAPERTIYFAFGHDEEVGGKDGAAAIVKHLAAQNVELEFAVDEGGVVTKGMFEGIDRPLAIIGVAEKGYVNTRLVVEDAGGHSSQPPPQTGLGVLARAIVAVEDNPFPATLDHLAMSFDYYGHYAPLGQRAAFANRWLFGPLIRSRLLNERSAAASMHTTIAATMASGSSKSNILPTRAEAVINHRILPGETAESVRERVERTIDDERVTVKAEMAWDPSPIAPTTSWGYELIASTIRGTDDSILVAPYLIQGGTDAKYYYALTPNVYRFMMITATPESLRYVHGIDERVSVEDYLRAVRFYAQLLLRASKNN